MSCFRQLRCIRIIFVRSRKWSPPKKHLHRRIYLIPEHNEPLPEELRDDVKKHIQTRYQVFIPVEILRKEIAPESTILKKRQLSFITWSCNSLRELCFQQSNGEAQHPPKECRSQQGGRSPTKSRWVRDWRWPQASEGAALNNQRCKANRCGSLSRETLSHYWKM